MLLELLQKLGKQEHIWDVYRGSDKLEKFLYEKVVPKNERTL